MIETLSPDASAFTSAPPKRDTWSESESVSNINKKTSRMLCRLTYFPRPTHPPRSCRRALRPIAVSALPATYAISINLLFQKTEEVVRGEKSCAGPNPARRYLLLNPPGSQKTRTVGRLARRRHTVAIHLALVRQYRLISSTLTLAMPLRTLARAPKPVAAARIYP